jgi:hypothetical protein
VRRGGRCREQPRDEVPAGELEQRPQRLLSAAQRQYGEHGGDRVRDPHRGLQVQGVSGVDGRGAQGIGHRGAVQMADGSGRDRSRAGSDADQQQPVERDLAHPDGDGQADPAQGAPGQRDADGSREQQREHDPDHRAGMPSAVEWETEATNVATRAAMRPRTVRPARVPNTPPP